MNFNQIDGTAFYEGFCIIKQQEIKTTSKGSQYLDLVLSDPSGDISAKFWDYKDVPALHFEKFDFIKVRGTFVPFNDTTQFRIDRIRKVNENDNVLLEDYVPSACSTGEIMFDEICNIIDSFDDEEYKSLVNSLIFDYREKLLYWPAAKNLHHAVRGGLLMHTLSILRLCKSVCEIYGFLNYDLLCSGAILHDLAKIIEISSSETGISGEYTVKGNLIGHLVLGAMEIDRRGRELSLSEEKMTLLEHMLISHHGVPEFGAAKYPMTAEAIVLADLDNLDARLFVTKTALNEVNQGEFTSKQWSMENRIIYRHNYESDGEINIV